MIKLLGRNTSGNVQKVLDGDLDLFIEAYLKWQLGNRGRENAA